MPLSKLEWLIAAIAAVSGGVDGIVRREARVVIDAEGSVSDEVEGGIRRNKMIRRGKKQGRNRVSLSLYDYEASSEQSRDTV